MTPETMTEAAAYLAEVRTALDDLTPAERDDLLEDLPGHLVEILADAGGPLAVRLGTPQTYAAELRASAGLRPRGAPPVRPHPLSSAAGALADDVSAWGRRLRDAALDLPFGPQVAAFLPELWPGWWVLRGYLAVAVPAAFGIFFGFGVLPFLTLFGSDLLGAVAVVAAVVWSVRLGRRSSALPVRRRQVVATGNLALVLLCVLAAVSLRSQVGYNTQISYAAADTSYLQGPNGGISNIYAFDSLGRPLRDVQLFDQDGRAIDSLLLQAPDGRYAEPVRTLDENGVEVGNVFPRTLKAETYGSEGPYVEEVRPPAIAPRRLADASPSPSPSPSASPSPSSTASPSPLPSGSPAASAAPTPTSSPAASLAPSASPTP